VINIDAPSGGLANYERSRGTANLRLVGRVPACIRRSAQTPAALLSAARSKRGALYRRGRGHIPGAGWHGFDPTNNKLAGGEHVSVSVAVAREQEKAIPLSGAWAGPRTPSTGWTSRCRSCMSHHEMQKSKCAVRARPSRSRADIESAQIDSLNSPSSLVRKYATVGGKEDSHWTSSTL
jgi:hypothetical protein